MKKLVFAILLLILFCGSLFSQNCNGKEGENIFLDGDFGTGASNNVSTDPNLAPDYNYTTNPPPADGSYVLTNNTGRWTNNFPGWFPLTDNSSDPNGYMMVINASFQPGLFYDKTLNGLCENTWYKFSADIINLHRIGFEDIPPNVDFLIDENVILQSGDIPQDQSWHNYSVQFFNDTENNSIRLSLRNNAPGGFGNDLALDNISFKPCGPETNISQIGNPNLCDGDSLSLKADNRNSPYDLNYIQWQYSDNGSDWFDIGAPSLDSIITTLPNPDITYYRYKTSSKLEYLNSNKCYVTADTKVIELHNPRIENEAIALCRGSSFTLANGEEIFDEGAYQVIFKNNENCDSLVLNYEVKISEKYFTDAEELILCEEVENRLIDGTRVTESGNHLINLVASNGCDSLVSVNIKLESCNTCTKFPSAFSPNNDGMNDYFGNVRDCQFTDFNLSIFNRWGQVVFESNDPNFRWDGKTNGKTSIGIYTWHCEFNVNNINGSKSGNVLLVR